MKTPPAKFEVATYFSFCKRQCLVKTVFWFYIDNFQGVGSRSLTYMSKKIGFDIPKNNTYTRFFDICFRFHVKSKKTKNIDGRGPFNLTLRNRAGSNGNKSNEI